MTPPERIRAAALGSTPQPHSNLRADWIGHDALWAARKVFGPGWFAKEFGRASETNKRMLLLFVAEALQSEALESQ